MSRICQVTQKKPMVGNKVSHANNKTKRRFNIQLLHKRVWLESENRYVSVRLSHHGYRTMVKKGIEETIKTIRYNR